MKANKKVISYHLNTKFNKQLLKRDFNYGIIKIQNRIKRQNIHTDTICTIHCYANLMGSFKKYPITIKHHNARALHREQVLTAAYLPGAHK